MGESASRRTDEPSGGHGAGRWAPRAFVALGLIVLIWAVDRFVLGAAGAYVERLIALSGVAIILAVSLNLINGFTGQFSLGHAGFMAIGGYLSAFVTVTAGPSIFALLGADPQAPAALARSLVLVLGLIAGALGAALAGLAIGVPTLRLKGDYLAIATLGFGEIIRVVILNIDAVGGARGMFGIPKYASFPWIAGLVVVTVVFHWNLVHSRHGRALLAIREDEIATESLGISTTRYKVLAFVIGAAFAGVAGGLSAHYLTYLTPDDFNFMKSVEIVIMVVLGGMGSISGSVLAAILLTLLPEVLRPIREYRMVIYSLLLVLLMLSRPQGIFGTRELDFGRLLRRRLRAHDGR